MQRHRAGGNHVLCSRQCGRKGPAASAGLTSYVQCSALPSCQV